MQDGPMVLTSMAPRPSALAVDPNSPATASAASIRMKERAQICVDLAGGTSVMLKKCAQYLPQETNEETADYNQRMRFASLRNYYAQAVTTILGKVFAEPPQLQADVPTDIAEMLENADLNGNHWTMTARSVMEKSIHYGLSWLLVDYKSADRTEGDLTLQQERELGLRPYWVSISQQDVLGVRYACNNGVYTLTQFRFYQQVMEQDGDYGESLVEYIYVWTPQSIVKWKRVSAGSGAGAVGNETKWVMQAPIDNTLGIIPVVPYYTDQIAPFEGKPPLENLAYMNVEHFQIRSSQRRALSVTSFPILATFGADNKAGTVKIGPLTSISLEDPTSDIKWIESNGVHLKAGAAELDKLEAQMRTFGLSFENPQMYATATGRNIDASDAIAPIQLWALTLKDVLEQALHFTALWLKKPSGGSVNVNIAFLKNSITVEGLKLLLEALKEGAISPVDFMLRMRDYGLVSDEFDPDASLKAAIEALKDKAEALPAPAAPKPTPGVPAKAKVVPEPTPTPA